MNDLHHRRMALACETLEIQRAFLTHHFQSERANEFAAHGLGRRLKSILHCVSRTFELIPIDGLRPGPNAVMDATAFLQSFIFNVFGAIDNIAHIWCAERAIKDSRGAMIPDRMIGLGKINKLVRASLSNEFHARLLELEEWFIYIEGYRHALAHRIPLYIPPYMVTPDEAQKFQELNENLNAARLESDWERINALWAEIDSLGTFQPCFVHSFGEGATPIMFHSQVLNDQATILELCSLMLVELDREL